MARTTDTHERREPKSITLAPFELAQLERVQEETGEESLSATVRALPRIWTERQILLRAILAPHRKRFSSAELKAIVDVCNGLYLAHELNAGEMLGQHVVMEVADGCELNGLAEKWSIDGPALVRRLADLPPAARAALELWAADLWKRRDDDALWNAQIAWLAGEAANQ